MPPHCDAEDGPVVEAAKRALDAGDVDLVLPFVHESGEQEVRDAFEAAMKVRVLGPEARALADRSFFETTVRVHRAGEGAPYTGLKPAGLDVGPVIPVAEQAIETGSADALIAFLTDAVRDEITRRFDAMLDARRHSDGVRATRTYVDAMLGLEVWSHKLFQAIRGSAHVPHAA
jgi:hypothetical protein